MDIVRAVVNADFGTWPETLGDGHAGRDMRLTDVKGNVFEAIVG